MSDPHVDGGVRLQKVLARAGIGSRRCSQARQAAQTLPASRAPARMSVGQCTPR